MGKRHRETFLHRQHTDGQEAHEKMFKSQVIREMQVKTTMRYHFIPVRMTLIKKIHKQQTLEMVWREGNPPALFVGMQIGTATMKDGMEVP